MVGSPHDKAPVRYRTDINRHRIYCSDDLRAHAAVDLIQAQAAHDSVRSAYLPTGTFGRPPSEHPCAPRKPMQFQAASNTQRRWPTMQEWTMKNLECATSLPDRSGK